jgi:hypothetical protein
LHDSRDFAITNSGDGGNRANVFPIPKKLPNKINGFWRKNIGFDAFLAFGDALRIWEKLLGSSTRRLTPALGGSKGASKSESVLGITIASNTIAAAEVSTNFRDFVFYLAEEQYLKTNFVTAMWLWNVGGESEKHFVLSPSKTPYVLSRVATAHA